MAFSQKQINVSFSLANGQFEGGGNSASLTGLRVACSIAVRGGADLGTASISIFGLPLAMMNQLVTIGQSFNKQFQNGVSITAGDANGMSQVWSGAIASAFVDGSMPNVCLRIISTPGVFLAVKPVPALSIKGTADVAGMLSNLAGQMGFKFENAGVTAKLANPYYAGTAWQQALAIAQHAGIVMTVERGVLAIAPPGTPRSGAAFAITPLTNMIGYPAFNQVQVVVKAQFDPAMKVMSLFQIAGSSLSSANGSWLATEIDYELESVIPHGKWFMTATGVAQGATPA
jgi:hypothetical protein